MNERAVDALLSSNMALQNKKTVMNIDAINSRSAAFGFQLRFLEFSNASSFAKEVLWNVVKLITVSTK